MSEICKTCGTDLAVANAAVVGRLLREQAHWDTWGARPVGWKSVVGGLGYVEIVYSFDDDSGFRSTWGEYEQGWTGNNSFVVQVVAGDHKGFYKKTGTKDSYGEVTWDGDLNKVTPTEKTVTTYDYA